MNGARRPAVVILETPVEPLGMDAVVARAMAMVERRSPGQIITANVDTVVGNHRSAAILAASRRAALTVADGVPLLWAASFLGAPLPGRVNGTDLMERLCAAAARDGRSIFLLGGPPGAAEAAAAALAARHPGLRRAGELCPAPGFEGRGDEHEAIRAMLRARCPDILFVSLGFPKGIAWIDANLDACGVPLALEVGMSFRYASGQMRRAPRWLRDHGLEWLWRLLHEPRRLWKRYLVRDLPFFWLLARQRLAPGRPPAAGR
jgi:N-acetylglucosaminyldiphosphoundecaprenol N-acetyl-beta-D-mannosaminyltransferase